MEVILDANVLFHTLISHGEIVTIFFDPKLLLAAPEKLRDEFIKNRSEILSKSALSDGDFEELTSLLFEAISFIPLKEYEKFLPKAKQLLGSHTKDADFVALCLMKNAKVWTYESRLFSLGIGVSTKEISSALKNDKDE